MKKVISLLALAATCSLFAQKIDLGETQENSFLGHSPNIVGEDGENIYAIDYYSFEKDVVVEAYEKEHLQINYRKTINIKELKGTRLELEKLAFINGNYVFFTSVFDIAQKNYKEKRILLIRNLALL